MDDTSKETDKPKWMTSGIRITIESEDRDETFLVPEEGKANAPGVRQKHSPFPLSWFGPNN